MDIQRQGNSQKIEMMCGPCARPAHPPPSALGLRGLDGGVGKELDDADYGARLVRCRAGALIPTSRQR